MKFTDTIKKLAKRARAFFPSALPQGMTAFDQFADSIIEIYNPPMTRRDVRFVISTLIMRLNPTDAYKSKRYFALSLHRGAAGQIANEVMYRIKEEQKAEQAAALEAQSTNGQAQV